VRQAQQCVDEIRQPIDLFEHAAHGFFVFCWRPGFPESGFTNATDDGQRCAELVRGVGREAAELLERRLEACERLVDNRGQPSNFVVLIRHGQALVQAVSRNASRFRRQMIDRRERPPCQHIPADSGQHDHQWEAEREDHEHFPQLLAQSLFGPGHSQDDRAATHE